MRGNLWILSTGTELTRGYSQDTNSSEIAQYFVENGFTISGIAILPDDKEILVKYIEFLLEDSSIQGIILTGGLGPTEDDHTIDVFQKITGLSIIEEKNSLKKLEEIAKTRKFNLDIARRQIRVLEKSKILFNPVGIAPGMILEYKNKLVAILPGVPEEMRSMLPSVLKEFSDKYPEKNFYHKEIFYIYNEPESEFQKNLSEIQKRLDTNFSWGVSANIGYLKIFIENTKPEQQEIFRSLYQEIQSFYKEKFLKTPIEQLIHKILIKEKKTLAIAESCTGGFLAKILTDTPGSSEYFLGSVVSYSNQLKKIFLDVEEEILNQYGAVSKECAEAMLKGLIQKTNPDFAISITGIAGPSGGTKEKPVGVVYIGVYDSKTIEIQKIFFPSTRDRIRKYSIFTALFFLYQKLKKVLQTN
ncbi:MAG: nicotinamide-nucleotide amidohydrolase family protein [Leptonema sp. (in: bacteria)]